MAINLNTEFTPRINAPDANYPTGSIKDSTTPTAGDGTPLRAVWGNDWQGFSDAMLALAGLTANGSADTAISSQRLDALLQIISDATGLIPVTGGGTLEINKRYLITDSNTYTLPDTTGLIVGKDNVEVYKLAASLTPLIQVDGTNAESIKFYHPIDAELIATDTNATYNIYASMTFIFNTDWEL